MRPAQRSRAGPERSRARRGLAPLPDAAHAPLLLAAAAAAAVHAEGGAGARGAHQRTRLRAGGAGLEAHEDARDLRSGRAAAAAADAAPAEALAGIDARDEGARRRGRVRAARLGPRRRAREARVE